ncbi:MAG: hypothetical protein CL811_10275 [Colwelliaceae bacterium]|nr:hypothetical protein [Colwelliaceae bacterium]
MSFLDNSGDIIIDAVLTDAGRKRMAAGDGAFQPVKFALGDDEINYALYDSANTSGSAYYDLDILKTPLLEAITRADSALKYKLLTIPNPELLYLPLLKLNTGEVPLSTTTNAYIVIVNDAAAEELAGGSTLPDYRTIFNGRSGYIDGRDAANAAATLKIKIDQGFDNSGAGGPGTIMESSLEELQFVMKVDSRYLEVVNPSNAEVAELVFVGSDKTATYLVTEVDDAGFFLPAPVKEKTDMAGPVGKQLVFSLKGGADILTNTTYYFDTFGRSVANFNGTTSTFNVIDSNIQVEGFTQGSVINIPIQFISF